MGDATGMEHDTEERLGGDAKVWEERGPGRNAIDTEEELVGILLTQKDQGVHNYTR